MTHILSGPTAIIISTIFLITACESNPKRYEIEYADKMCQTESMVGEAKTIIAKLQAKLEETERLANLGVEASSTKKLSQELVGYTAQWESHNQAVQLACKDWAVCQYRANSAETSCTDARNTMNQRQKEAAEFIKSLRQIELGSAQPVQVSSGVGQPKVIPVSISPADQLISDRDFSNLDRNKYEVNNSLRVAVLKPSSDSWEIFSSKDIPNISLLDIPMISEMMHVYQAMFSDDRPQVFGVRKRQGHEITINKNSRIQEVPVTISLADNLDALTKFLSQLSRSQGKPDLVLDAKELSQIRDKIRLKSAKLVDKKLPIKKQIYSGVYAMPLSKEIITSDLIKMITPRSSILDDSLMYFSLSGGLSSGALANLFVNQERAIASYDASVWLEDVMVDGKVTSARLNNVGFIVAGKDRAVVVQIMFLSVDGISDFTSLQEFLNSFRFSA